jgi:hypothetical protein
MKSLTTNDAWGIVESLFPFYGEYLRYNTREFATKEPVILTSEKGD